MLPAACSRLKPILLNREYFSEGATLTRSLSMFTLRVNMASVNSGLSEAPLAKRCVFAFAQLAEIKQRFFFGRWRREQFVGSMKQIATADLTNQFSGF